MQQTMDNKEQILEAYLLHHKLAHTYYNKLIHQNEQCVIRMRTKSSIIPTSLLFRSLRLPMFNINIYFPIISERRRGETNRRITTNPPNFLIFPRTCFSPPFSFTPPPSPPIFSSCFPLCDRHLLSNSFRPMLRRFRFEPSTHLVSKTLGVPSLVPPRETSYTAQLARVAGRKMLEICRDLNVVVHRSRSVPRQKVQTSRPLLGTIRGSPVEW